MYKIELRTTNKTVIISGEMNTDKYEDVVTYTNDRAILTLGEVVHHIPMDTFKHMIISIYPIKNTNELPINTSHNKLSFN